jgi:tetratricopeptide (TPR) repeat protein
VPDRSLNPDLASEGYAGMIRRQRVLAPMEAIALAHAGFVAQARSLAAATPADCVFCLRARGQTAALAGDAAGADRAFAEALRQAPSLPFAYAEWGEAKLARGDVTGALALFRRAREKGPRWADAAKLEGDALARMGKPREAAGAYAAAAELAPRWGGLHLKWGEALARLGQADSARAMFRAAGAMDLSAADRAELAARSN